jgi:hypothetical protein
MRLSFVSGLLFVLLAACSSSGGGATPPAGVVDAGMQNLDDSGKPKPTTDGSAGVGDGATTSEPTIMGDPVDVTKAKSIQGTFLTDLANGTETIPVKWSFDIGAIAVSAAGTGTAVWNSRTVPADAAYPPSVNVALSVQSTGAGDYEFYGTSAAPYAYVLVKISAKKVVDFYYYRRVLDDAEVNPADKPRMVRFTVTN